MGIVRFNLRSIAFFITLIGLLQLVSCADQYQYQESKHIVLDKGWKFNPRDNAEYLKVTYNDSGWDSVEVARSWQKQGVNYVGFAWYRIKVFIPSSLRRSNKDSLKLILGVVKDADQVFLNGSIIGENGQTVSAGHLVDSSFTYSGMAGPRKYMLHANDPRILWDKENVLAIRVFDKGERGGGGLVADIPFIGVAGLEDSIVFGKKFYKPDEATGAIDTNLTMTNISSRNLKGELFINCTEVETGKQIYDNNFSIELKPGESKLFPVSLEMTMDQLKVSLLFNEHKIKETVRDSLMLPFVLIR